MMLVQTGSVIQILTGRDSGWGAQARDADRVPWALLWRFHRRHMLAGVLLAVAAGAISWRLLAWMSPALFGLVLAVPLAGFMGSAAAGRALARAGPAADAGGTRSAAPRRRGGRGGGGVARAGAARRAPGLLADPRPSPGTWPGSTRQRRAVRARQIPPLGGALLKLADGLPLDRLDLRESLCGPRLGADAGGLAPHTGAAAAGEAFVMLRRAPLQVAHPILRTDTPRECGSNERFSI